MTTIHSDLINAQIRHVEHGPYRTRIIEAGEGPALVMMHGGGGHAEAFSRNVERLSKHFRVICPDFIWHGQSSCPAFVDGNWCRQFTDQILSLLTALGIERASFEGESLGGWVAMDVALRFAQRVEKIILNTAWGMDMGTERNGEMASLREASINALRNPSRETIERRMHWLMPLGGTTDEIVDVRLALWSRPQTRDALIAYYEHLFAPECKNYLFRAPDLARIEVPTLLLWTEKNPVAGPDTAEAMARAIPDSRVHIVADAAHWPQWERPEEHDRVVTEFLLES
ncbi:alpha/beta hydrolase [Paraburkholderia sp. J63]|uniref:alpha/beta fold hydrolase n=1 Tax=Paraburkholderia sp. J63 TaxID=2805434 RepID=UPI002ABDCCDE|nr:alpha/beta hydrolase [Paraburkholderia sp. J63]